MGNGCCSSWYSSSLAQARLRKEELGERERRGRRGGRRIGGTSYLLWGDSGLVSALHVEARHAGIGGVGAVLQFGVGERLSLWLELLG